MKCENIGKPWANEEEFTKALAAAPDNVDDKESDRAVWSNRKLTLPGQHPFQQSSKPLAEQFGATAAKKIALLNVGEDTQSFASLLPADNINSSTSAADLILFFVRHQQDIDKLLPVAAARLSMERTATLWVCSPSQPSESTDGFSPASMLRDAEILGLINDAFLPVDTEWICWRLRRS
jgi:hypothetical protein